MRNHFLTLAAVVLSAAALGACCRNPEDKAVSEKEAVIVPLNARDPSALVMGPSAQPVQYYEADADAQTGAPAPQRPPRPYWARLFGKRFDRTLMVDGYRVVSLPVREYELLDVRPGDRVDVLSIFQAAVPGKWKQKLSATLLQNVKVLGVALSGDLNGQGVLQLMLNPSEAQFATLALHQGELSVILRKPGDVDIYPMEMSSFRKLFR